MLQPRDCFRHVVSRPPTAKPIHTPDNSLNMSQATLQNALKECIALPLQSDKHMSTSKNDFNYVPYLSH